LNSGASDDSSVTKTVTAVNVATAFWVRWT